MLIEADGLSRSFGGHAAVAGVSFSIGAGEIVALLGPNGAGKSTLLRLLSGVLRPDAGIARIAGLDIHRSGIGARRRLGYLPEAASGFHHLTVRELLTFAGEARGLHGKPLAVAIRHASVLLALTSALDRVMRTLSKGWQQRAWLAQVIIHDPPVLILDEPTDGLDPTQKLALRAFLKSAAKGKAILMSTHILEEAEALCGRVLIIAGGRLVADAPRAELADRDGRLADAFGHRTLATAPAGL